MASVVTNYGREIFERSLREFFAIWAQREADERAKMSEQEKACQDEIDRDDEEFAADERERRALGDDDDDFRDDDLGYPLDDGNGFEDR